MPMLRYVSFYPMPGVDRQEYFDWLRIHHSTEEQAAMDISGGNVPAGMIVEWKHKLYSVWSDNQLRRFM